MVKIQYKKAEVDFKIIRDQKNLPQEILFYNPHSKEYVDELREITLGWNFDNDDDNKSLEEIIRFIEVLDWADFILELEDDDDIFKLNFHPIGSLPGADAVSLEKVGDEDQKLKTDFNEEYAKIKETHELLSKSDCGSFEFYYQESLITVVDHRDEKFIEYRKEDDKDEFNHTLAILERSDLIS